MLYKQLKRRHVDFDPKRLKLYQALFAGGEAIEMCIADFLPKHDLEPDPVWKKRTSSAYYQNYVGPLAAHFAGYLFTSAPVKAQKDDGPLPDFYSQFDEDCDGRGTDFDNFMGLRFVRALIQRRAYWRVVFPAEWDPATMKKAEWEQLGLGRATVEAIPTENIVHWKRSKGPDGKDGPLEWVVEYEREQHLEDFEDKHDTITETWTRWHADGSVRRWQVQYLDDKKSAPKDTTDVPEVEPPANPLGKLPIVELALPEHLFMMGHVAGPATEHLRKLNAQSWAIDRTCYVMPYFHLKDRRRPPKSGTGFYGILGVDEEVSWPAPPNTPFEIVASHLATLKDEIHRVSHQMARGVDNNAAAIGRSGESKEADNRSTEVVLKAFGSIVKQKIEETLQLVASGRGEELEIHVGGMDTYHLADAQALALFATTIAPLSIMGSPTGKRQLARQLWQAGLPNLSQDDYQKIGDETDALITDDDTGAMTPPPGAGAGGVGSGEQPGGGQDGEGAEPVDATGDWLADKPADAAAAA